MGSRHEAWVETISFLQNRKGIHGILVCGGPRPQQKSSETSRCHDEQASPPSHHHANHPLKSGPERASRGYPCGCTRPPRPEIAKRGTRDTFDENEKTYFPRSSRTMAGRLCVITLEGLGIPGTAGQTRHPVKGESRPESTVDRHSESVPFSLSNANPEKPERAGRGMRSLSCLLFFYLVVQNCSFFGIYSMTRVQVCAAPPRTTTCPPGVRRTQVCERAIQPTSVGSRGSFLLQVFLICCHKQ